MRIPEPQSSGVPEWIVTFGDMMSLLLTFFIMLVSMSEIKQQDRYQAVAESLRRKFGHDTCLVSEIPGLGRPQTSVASRIATLGRARRLDTMRGGDKVLAPSGDSSRVQQIRRRHDPTQGGEILFSEGSAELTAEAKAKLREIAQYLQGKPQKIEIRGHTSTRPHPPDSPFHNHWDLAYARCSNTMEYLVRLGIDRKRLTLGIAADNEPVDTSEDPEKLRENARVEVYLLNELADGLEPASQENPQKPPKTAAP